MLILKTIADLRQALKIEKDKGRILGLVPTMGNLHQGHMSLVEKSKAQCDFTLTTIFINPTQFGPNEDLLNYPQSFSEDKEKLAALGCDAIFAPAVKEIYPTGPKLKTLVTVPALGSLHCGASRPGHFDAVCTIVTKFFNLCQPDKAFFGQKDYQQLTIINRLVADLNLPIEIIAVPTQREASGLALSSRNSYLSTAQKQQASVLYTSLKNTAEALHNGSSATFKELEQEATKAITAGGLKTDYFTICHASTLLPATVEDKEQVILTAAYLGKTRLIDNISVNL